MTNKATRHSIVREEMTIEADLVDFVAGRKGINLKRLKEVCGVNVILPPRGGIVYVYHHKRTRRNGIRRQERNWRKAFVPTRCIIEKDYIPMVIGREGESVNAMQDKLNVNIAISKVERS